MCYAHVFPCIIIIYYTHTHATHFLSPPPSTYTCSVLRFRPLGHREDTETCRHQRRQDVWRLPAAHDGIYSTLIYIYIYTRIHVYCTCTYSTCTCGSAFILRERLGRELEYNKGGLELTRQQMHDFNNLLHMYMYLTPPGRRRGSPHRATASLTSQRS